MKKRGVSPVVATVLLIAIVVILAAIIILWARSFFEEKAEKFGKSEDQACSEVMLDAEYNSGELDIVNRGDIPLYGFKLEIIERGSSEIMKVSGTEYTGESVSEGASTSVSVSISSGTEKIKIIPILLGKSKGIKKSFVCDNKYGKEVLI